MDENRANIAKELMNMEFIPEIVEMTDINLTEYSKIPLSQFSAMGVAFEPMVSAFQQFLGGGVAKSGLYRVSVPPNMHLAAFKDGSGYLSSALHDANNQGFKQATLNPLSFDPTTLFMAAALVQIDKKLDSIQEMQRELLDFLAQKERSELRGDLNFLTDVVNNYKHNWDNEKYKSSHYIKVLDILQSAERKIDFFKEQIASKSSKKSFFHGDQEVKKLLDKMQIQFKDYQVALYLHAFSSFLQVMLLENFDSAYLESIVSKIKEYSLEYRELYSHVFEKIENLSLTSVQSTLIKGIASVNKKTGEAIAKVPIISKSQMDEGLIKAGEKLEQYGFDRSAKTMQQFLEKQDVFVKPFIDSINTVSRLYNKPLELIFDDDGIYLEVA